MDPLILNGRRIVLLVLAELSNKTMDERRSAGTLGDPARGPCLDLHPTPGAREHLNQCINAETVDFAGHQVAHAWLAYVEELGGRMLGQFARAHKVDEFDHQVCANPKVLSLVGGEPNVEEHVSARPRRHRQVLSQLKAG